MELNIPLKYREDIDIAVRILKNEGCHSVYLFGSVATGKFHQNSDIDIGIKGLPQENFFRVFGQLGYCVSNDIDLVDFDENDKFFNLLDSLGEVIKIG